MKFVPKTLMLGSCSSVTNDHENNNIRVNGDGPQYREWPSSEWDLGA